MMSIVHQQDSSSESKQAQEKAIQPMIAVEDVDMTFNIANEQLNSLKEYFIALVRGKLFFKEFKALENISFTVNKGDVYGIVGTNGSGKSTLLKIISGVLEPTHGSCSVYGSIAPLIELGAGFDPDLTARENVYLNGSLLGYSKKFIDEHFDEIVEFAEVEDFIDMPLKNYSSGMTARIAFAIATATTPDVLVVDEALSVGDFMFQEKCERRINDLVKNHGTTLLFVSHSIDQVERVCEKALWIEKGHMRMQGTVEDVCFCYRNMEYTDFVENNGILDIKRATKKELNAPIDHETILLALWRCAGKPGEGEASDGQSAARSWAVSIGLILPNDGNLAQTASRQDLVSAVYRFSLWRKPSANGYEPADESKYCDTFPHDEKKRAAIEWALHHKLVVDIKSEDGSRSLALDEPATLVQLAKVISCLYKNVYSYPRDVSLTDWYVLHGYYDYVTERGIISGYENDLFGPNDPVTRGQAATILWRCAGKPEPSRKCTFPDVHDGDFFGKAVAWAEEQGLMEGNDEGKFKPNLPIEKDDLSCAMYRYIMVSLGKTPSRSQADVETWCERTGIFHIEKSEDAFVPDRLHLHAKTKSAIVDENVITRALMTQAVAILQRDILPASTLPERPNGTK